MGPDGQQGEPWVNWLEINQNPGGKKHSAPRGEGLQRAASISFVGVTSVYLDCP